MNMGRVGIIIGRGTTCANALRWAHPQCAHRLAKKVKSRKEGVGVGTGILLGDGHKASDLRACTLLQKTTEWWEQLVL